MKGELIEAYENGFQTNREELACEKANLKRKELAIRKEYADLHEKQDRYYRERMILDEKEKALEERENQVRSREDTLKREMRGIFERTKQEAKKDFEWIYPITQDMIILLIGIFILSSIESGFFSDMIGIFKCMYTLFLNAQNFASNFFGQDPLIVKFLAVGLIGWILPLLIVALCIVISGYLAYRYYKDCFDSTSRRYLLVSLAFCVFILGIVKRHSSVSLNSFLVFFILQTSYILARAIIDMKNRGYYDDE